MQPLLLQRSTVGSDSPARHHGALAQEAEQPSFKWQDLTSSVRRSTKFMPLNRLVLVLNASYEPVNICSARRAMKLICKGAAVVEVPSTHTVHTSQLDIQLPSVIRLRKYRRVPRFTRSVYRKGVILRDQGTCQYCARTLPGKDLTMDHVIPRSRGGASTWENLVACCFPCNNRKADRTPSEAGMTLIHQPRRIGIHAKHRLLAGDNAVWDQYLFV